MTDLAECEFRYRRHLSRMAQIDRRQWQRVEGHSNSGTRAALVAAVINEGLRLASFSRSVVVRPPLENRTRRQSDHVLAIGR